MTPLEWRSLGKDHLYIRSEFSSDSYRIWGTDLARLWYEELDADDIISRAKKYKVQIDVEDPSNLSILLQHLSRAAQAGNINDTEPKKGSSREFHAAIDFPEPLPAATWIFRLELQDVEDFRNEVTIPLFEQINRQERSEANLIQRMQDKNHVIEKLLDALDKYSVDLAGIFPALATLASNRKAPSRRDAEVHIPALKPFDRQQWREGIQQGQPYKPEEFGETLPSLEAISYQQRGNDIERRDAYTHSKDTVNGTPKGIKKSIGGLKAISSDKVEASEIRGSTENSTLTPVQAKGIRKNIGGHKSAAGRLEPVNGRDRTKSPEIVVHRLPAPDRSKVVRTSNPVTEESRSLAGKTDTEDADVDAHADAKRKVLRRNLEIGAAPKAKKRKF